MSKAAVLTLIENLGLDMQRDDAVSETYDEIVRELSFAEVITAVSNVTLAPDERQTALPDAANLVLGAAFEGAWLDRASLSAVEGALGHWRDGLAEPIAFIQEDQSTSTFSLYPAPRLGGTVRLIYTDHTRSDLPAYLDWFLACAVIEREYSRYSNHADLELARVAGGLARLAYDAVVP